MVSECTDFDFAIFVYSHSTSYVTFNYVPRVSPSPSHSLTSTGAFVLFANNREQSIHPATPSNKFAQESS